MRRALTQSSLQPTQMYTSVINNGSFSQELDFIGKLASKKNPAHVHFITQTSKFSSLMSSRGKGVMS
jgi:hypothetical protein